MDNGFITLHRKLLQSAVFEDSDLLKVWIWCLLRANHKDCEVVHARQIVVLKRGEFITGTYSGSEELNMSTKVFRNRLKILVMLGQIEQKGASKYTIINVVKYDFYQNKEIRGASKGQAKGKQRATDNNVNNVNNISEDKSSHLLGKKKDMPWKQYNENDHSDDLPAIDVDGNKIPSKDDLLKEKNAQRTRYKKDLVEWLIVHQNKNRKLVTQQWRNKQFKALGELWDMHIDRPRIIKAIVEYEGAEWFEGNPDFRSIVGKFEKSV